MSMIEEADIYNILNYIKIRLPGNWIPLRRRKETAIYMKNVVLSESVRRIS